MDYDVLVFVLRAQPFHLGHKAVVDEALRRSKRVVLVLGSHMSARNIRNPFTTEERISMISAVYPHEVEQQRIVFAPQPDHIYNDERWVREVQASVNVSIWQGKFNPDPVKVGLIGHSKDETSFYLKIFPTYSSVEIKNVVGINATDIRNVLFRDGRVASDMLPVQVSSWLNHWCQTNNRGYFDLVNEFMFIKDYKEQWKAAPYPPTFVTVDSVVIQSGHILLVKRRSAPGRGLLALPGGFVNQKEKLMDAAIRELREETKIAVPEPVLRGSVVHDKTRTFDDPNRSQRGRTITTAFLVRLTDRTSLPKVKGADDAEKAFWMELSELRRDMFFEDHMDIIETMVGI